MAENPVSSDVHLSLAEAWKQRQNSPAAHSIDWLRGKVKDLFGSSSKLVKGAGNQFPKEINRNFLTNKIAPQAIGRMFMFTYDPKTKSDLPYYDTLPLVILVDVDSQGFSALNLHYVPGLARVQILEELTKNIASRDGDKLVFNDPDSSVAINYAFLKKSAQFPLLAPCFKNYLFSHVKSPFLYVDPNEWMKAATLPVERFQKKSTAAVHRESMARKRTMTKRRNG